MRPATAASLRVGAASSGGYAATAPDRTRRRLRASVACFNCCRGRRGLPEGEHVGLRAGLEEGDLERPLTDRVVLAYELMEAAFAEQAVAVLVDVEAVRAAWGLAVE